MRGVAREGVGCRRVKWLDLKSCLKLKECASLEVEAVGSEMKGEMRRKLFEVNGDGAGAVGSSSRWEPR